MAILSDDELLDLKHMEADAFRGGSKEMILPTRIIALLLDTIAELKKELADLRAKVAEFIYVENHGEPWPPSAER